MKNKLKPNISKTKFKKQNYQLILVYNKIQFRKAVRDEFAKYVKRRREELGLEKKKRNFKKIQIRNK